MTDPRRPEISFPSDEEVLITAWLEASPIGVFRAYTTPALVTQWWGRPAGRLTTCEIDLRVGGQWHYVYAPEGGDEVGYHGHYTDVAPGEMVGYTDVLENLGGVEARNTVTFTPERDLTVMRILARHVGRANRDVQSATLSAEAMVTPFQLLAELARTVDA